MPEDYGIKTGPNLNTDTDQLLKLTSAHSSLKLYKWYDAQFTTDGSGDGSVSIPHDLGYVPIVQVWGKHTAQFTFLSGTTYSNAFSLIDSVNSYRPYGMGIDYYADADEIIIRTTAVGSPVDGGASPSTTYHFRVLIWVDLSENFTGSSTIDLNDDFGFKISNKGKDVFIGKEYEMTYSSKYKAIQYYPNHIVHSSLTLPEMWASRYDNFVQEATYVDFMHNLGYAPMFLFYSDVADATLYEMPFSEIDPFGPTYKGLTEVSAWCDANRIRVLFHRASAEVVTGDLGTFFPTTTIAIHMMILAENLQSTPSP